MGTTGCRLRRSGEHGPATCKIFTGGLKICYISRYGFPGLRSFEENDAAIFNGRSKEKQQLFDLIMVERVLVMFAKSGAGKSSLLRAGIVPMLAGSWI